MSDYDSEPEEMQEEVEEGAPRIFRPERTLTMLVKTAAQVEKLRVSTQLRISAVDRGATDPDQDVPPVYTDVFNTMSELEDTIDTYCREELKRYPVYNSWLVHVKGIGPGLAAQLLGLLLPPLPNTNASTWYKAAGLAPEMRPDGQHRLPKPRKGEGKVTYYPYLRRCLFNVGESFMRTNGYYRGVYDTARARLNSIHADDEQWPKIRLHRVAVWIMVKVFLQNLYTKWGEGLGYTMRAPYAIDILPGHSHLLMPPDWEKGDGKV